MSERWGRIRAGLYAVGVLMGLIVTFLPAADDEAFLFHELPIWANILIGMIMLCGVPLGLLFVIGIQAINPFSDKHWERPTHRHNFFRLGNPLLFFHFFGWFAICINSGIVVAGVFGDRRLVLEGLFGVMAGGLFVLGVELAIRVFSSKVVEPGSISQ